MDPRLPATIGARDLRPLIEVFSDEDDEDGNWIFLYSSYGFITDDYRVFFGQAPVRKSLLTSKDILDSLHELPDDDVWPQVPEYATVTSDELDRELYYYKGPMLHTAYLGNGYLPKLTLQEIETLELLRKHPHPNIVPYHGCLVRRDRVVSLVFDRLPMTLQIRAASKKWPQKKLDIERCMISITSAIDHLHSLGLAHNDLNPENIMVDQFDTLFLIDFGSCQPFGRTLITAGTRGWIEEEFIDSAQAHDGIALKKIRAWLDELGDQIL